jgi:crotonobetainyl-CoA:carnitine CoA-transferase CaiB-like acyl-CoA transferase
MFETMASFVLQEHLAQQSFNPPVGPPGDLRLLSPHNQPVKTKNGFISFTINTDSQVQAFLKITDRSEILSDERFKTVSSRAQFVAEWFEIRGAALTNKSTEEWLTLFRENDLPAMPCHSLESLTNDPHLKAVELVNFENHPTEGTTAVIRSTIQINGNYSSSKTSAAPKGWDTNTILNELGFLDNEKEQFIKDNVVYQFKDLK